eukprot:355645-Chlamydomonas_euryale.AAC.6
MRPHSPEHDPSVRNGIATPLPSSSHVHPLISSVRTLLLSDSAAARHAARSPAFSHSGSREQSMSSTRLVMSLDSASDVSRPPHKPSGGEGGERGAVWLRHRAHTHGARTTTRHVCNTQTHAQMTSRACSAGHMRMHRLQQACPPPHAHMACVCVPSLLATMCPGCSFVPPPPPSGKRARGGTHAGPHLQPDDIAGECCLVVRQQTGLAL